MLVAHPLSKQLQSNIIHKTLSFYLKPSSEGFFIVTATRPL